MIDWARDRQRMGLLHTRLTQMLRDLLIDKKVAEYPIVEIVSRADWDQRTGA